MRVAAARGRTAAAFARGILAVVVRVDGFRVVFIRHVGGGGPRSGNLDLHRVRKDGQVFPVRRQRDVFIRHAHLVIAGFNRERLVFFPVRAAVVFAYSRNFDSLSVNHERAVVVDSQHHVARGGFPRLERFHINIPLPAVAEGTVFSVEGFWRAAGVGTGAVGQGVDVVIEVIGVHRLK